MTNVIVGIVTFIFASVLWTVVYFNIKLVEATQENEKLQKKINKQEQDLLGYECTIQQYQEDAAYHKGLNEARETDTLYRSMLEKIRNGDHATVLVGNGA